MSRSLVTILGADTEVDGTTSLYMPDVLVEIAFGSGVRTPAADRVWTDVSAYVELADGIEIIVGRADQFSTADANQCNLALDNSDGRFTSTYASSPYYPNVKIGTPIRVSATTVTGVASIRFVGFVDEWPVEWPGATSNYAIAPIKASSRLAALGRGRKLRSIVEEEILADGPVAYYPLGEAEGAMAAADASGSGAPSLVPTGSGAAVVFGTGTGPGTDGLTAATFAGGKRLSQLYGSSLLSGVTTVLIEASFSTSTTALQQRIMSLTNSAGAYVPAAELISLGVDQTTGVLRGGYGAAGVNIVTTQSAGSVADGSVHHAAFRVTLSGGNADATLWLDGVEVDTDLAASGAFPTAIDTINVGGDRNAISGVLHFTGSIAHAAAFTGTTEIADARVIAHATASLTGFEGETPADRIARYAAYADIPAVEVDAEVGTSPMAHIDTTGKSSLDAMRLVEATEGGVLYDARDCTLTFQSRSHRYPWTSTSFILNISTQEVQADFRPVVDRSQIQNDVTATLADGTVSARVVDAASVTAYDAQGDELELHTTDVDEPHAAASWRVNSYSEPTLRIPAVSVDVLSLSTSKQNSVLDADVGTRFSTTFGPDNAGPAANNDYFIEGWSELIGPESYGITFNVSDAGVWLDVFVLDSNARGYLDTNRLGY